MWYDKRIDAGDDESRYIGSDILCSFLHCMKKPGYKLRYEQKWSENNNMKIFAHRGFSGKYPENTMLAYTKAVEGVCDGIELDVQLTKDRIMVLIHDELIDRTSNGKGFVRDYTYQELLQYDFSAKFAGIYGINQIPTLYEYLDWMKEKDVFTNIELKNSVCYYGGMEEMVLEEIRKRGLEERILLSSFNNVSVLKCKRLAPGIQTAFLTESSIWNAGRYVSENNVDCYHPDLKWLTKEEVCSCKEYGVKVNVWRVNKEDDFEKVADFGVDGVFTNYPDRAEKYRDNN
jgi:glycerophosphoryl diester phosphodiesterase